jgi:hypothetical protein
LCAKGLTTGEIAAHLVEVYGMGVSKETISKITDAVLAEMQRRPEPVPRDPNDRRAHRDPSLTVPGEGGSLRRTDNSVIVDQLGLVADAGQGGQPPKRRGSSTTSATSDTSERRLTTLALSGAKTPPHTSVRAALLH